MDAWKIINGWLSQLNPLDASMRLDAHGQCRLVLEGDEHCTVRVPHARSTEFLLFQDLMILPSACPPVMYEEILKLNLPSGATRDGSLAFDAEQRSVIFIYAREIACTDFNTFCTVLENLLRAGRAIKSRLTVLEKEMRDAGASPAGSGAATLSKFNAARLLSPPNPR